MLEADDRVDSADCTLVLNDNTAITAIGALQAVINGNDTVLDELDLVVGIGTTTEGAA
jgi:hypothetical protein